MESLYLQEYKTHRESFIKRFEITKLPPYLILFIKVHDMHTYSSWEDPHQHGHIVQRFTKNNFFVEKNPTIVNFPIK